MLRNWWAIHYKTRGQTRKFHDSEDGETSDHLSDVLLTELISLDRLYVVNPFIKGTPNDVLVNRVSFGPLKSIMSDRVSLKHVLSGGESVDASQSLWMAHWTRRSHNPLSQDHEDQMEGDCEAKQEQTSCQSVESRKAKRLDSDAVLGESSEHKHARGALEVDVRQSSKGTVPETRRIEITHELLMANSKDAAFPDKKATQLDSLSIGKLPGISPHRENFILPKFPCYKNRSSERQPLQEFGLNKKMEGIKPQLDDNSGHGTADISMSLPRLQSRVLSLSSNEINFRADAQHGRSEQQIRPDYFEKKLVPLVRSLHEDSTVSNSNSMLCGLNPRRPDMIRKGKNDQSSLGLSCKGHFGNSHFTRMEHEQCNSQTYSAFFPSDTIKGRNLIPESSESQYSAQKDGALLLNDDPMVGNVSFSIPVREQGRKFKKFSDTGLLSSQSSTQRARALEDLECEHHFLHRMPTCCLQDVETMRICATVDSVEGVPGGLPKFSKTTHHLLITKKTDVNSSKGVKLIKGSTFAAELKGKSVHKMLALPPSWSCLRERETKSQNLQKFADSEEKGDGDAVLTGFQHVRNESSAETDTMPTDDFNQSSDALAGTASSLLHKDVMGDRTAGKCPEPATSQSKWGKKRKITDLPDMNKDPSADLAAANSIDARELSTSRTESLDAEHLLSHVEQPENSNSSPQNGNLLGPEASSRWVKRLGLSASDSLTLGTKSLKMGDASSSEVNKLFNRITNCSKTSSEPMLGQCRGTGSQRFDKTMTLLKNIDSTIDSVKDCPNPSHPWIRRWCHSREVAEPQKSAPQVACEPEKSKFSFEELQKKQFPSIAAMALMGKAVSNFHPCEFRKKGSSVVWNT